MQLPLGDRAPVVHEGAWTAPNATLVGDVHLTSGVSVWYGAVLRGDGASIRIGQGTNIQDNCVVHVDPGFPVTVGKGVSVGHGAVLHGCTVADDVLIGMNATVLNGAHVGAGSLIAAGALITEGAEIPEGSLVAGVPGKVRRSLTAAELDHIRANAKNYTDLLVRHRAAGASLP